MSEPSVIQVALQCAEAFEQVQAGYFLGGSLASSLQGEPRATNDIDFVVDLQPAQWGEEPRRGESSRTPLALKNHRPLADSDYP
jgi:hypothetical protein